MSCHKNVWKKKANDDVDNIAMKGYDELKQAGRQQMEK